MTAISFFYPVSALEIQCWYLNLPWLLLGVATSAALIRPAWGIWIALPAVAAAAVIGVLTPWYALLVVLAGYLLHFTDRLSTTGVISVHIGVSLFVLASGLHLIPGAAPLIVIAGYQKTADSMLYTLGFSFDKTLAPLALMIIMPAMVLTKKCGHSLPVLLAVIAGGILSILLLAWATGFIKPDVAVPGWTGLFILKMICYTAFAEEVFFRGYVQNLLTARWGPTVGVIIAAVLFGVAHSGGGVTLVVLSSLAGIVYGLSYHLSGRLWTPVAVHTALNTAHLILFTYPAAA